MAVVGVATPTIATIWNVFLNGQQLDIRRKRSINSIEIKTACDGSDTCTLTITDKEMEYINDNIFIEEATVSVSIMFVGTAEKIEFSGYVSAIDIDFPEDGMPTLTLTCMDHSHVMNREKKKRSWDKVTRMQVAQKIATEYGFKFKGEPEYAGKVEDTISQSNETDIAFLENLASQEEGVDIYMCKLVGDTLVYKKKGVLSEPVMTVHYKKYPYEVRSFSPKINKESMQDETTEEDIATDTKKTDTKKSKGTNKTQGQKVTTNSKGSSGGTSKKNGGSGEKTMKYDNKTGTWK